MTGPGRVPPGVSSPGEDAHSSETSSDPLEWQNELDVAIADIDSRLRHPRRRATDAQPPARPRGMTTEVIDEIAWRVAELLREDGRPPIKPTEMAAAITQVVTAGRTVVPPGAPSLQPAPLPPPLPEPTPVPDGIAVTLRLRQPFLRLPWPFNRRKGQRMILFSDYRVS